ncbi:VWA domain-containing protein [Saxibacter everestensis]|uniref:VWA domain-containing protein n=1 Tax=Saxibacter everestensis TaxID=2909229 RepID=A0ABY8QPC2_9MICO|nr:VWA domain-containing protein [Brevibacteriaceae bacterium ZFBP1038]
MSFLPTFSWWGVALVFVPLLVGTGALAWRSAQRRRAWLLRLGMVVLMLCVAVRPGVAGGEARAGASDVDVFFVVDTTSSIAAEDYDGKPRLEGVRSDIRQIATKLAGARFSLITFDGAATMRLPLTTDTTALSTVSEVLAPEITMYSRSSSISAARELLTERLKAAKKSHPERSRAVFYLGDGEQTAGSAPESFADAAELIDGGGVLGYGTSQGGRMRENLGYQGPSRYIRSAGSSQDAESVIDETNLRAIAEQLGVGYTHRAAGEPIGPALDDAQPGDLSPDSGLTSNRIELYWIPAGALSLLLAGELAGLLRARRDLQPRRKARA